MRDKKEYQVYKRHHKGQFIGWEVASVYRGKVTPVCAFYGKGAKDRAVYFRIDLTCEWGCGDIHGGIYDGRKRGEDCSSKRLSEG